MASSVSDFSDEDWRSRCKSVTETHSEARRRTLFIDVRFLVGQSKTSRYFSAHKMILACGSPVFEAMFFGQLAERNDPVTIPDDDPEAFEIMLRYLYGECIFFPSIVIACKSYCIADKYLIPELQKKSAKFISNAAMDDENFWGLIEGNLLTNKYSEKRFRSYVQLNADKLLISDEFLQVPEEIVKSILQMDELNISELELLTSVTKWCLKKFTKETMYKTQDLLKSIRFSLLTPKDFCLFTDNFPDVLDTLTCMRILKHLIDPNVYGLPFWCTIVKTERKIASPALPFMNPNFYFPPPKENTVPLACPTPPSKGALFHFGTPVKS